MAAWHFEGEPGTERRPNGHAKDQPIDWPEPVDILADPRLTGVATVDDTCLSASILKLAVAEGGRLQVDPAHIAVLAIGACSAVVSDDWRVQLKVNDQGWTQHPAIRVAVVGESGRKKTDSFRCAACGVLQLKRKLREDHDKAMARHVEGPNRWEALPKSERGREPKPPAEVSYRTLEKWRLTGDGPPYIKLGRRVVYDIQDLDAWAGMRRRQSTSDVP